MDDEVTVLLTLKAVLEISGFDVHTAASAREARSKIRLNEYHMVITDMRMESDAAGAEVVRSARTAPYHPAVALLTAFPVDDEGWDDGAPDKVLVKATQTKVLLQQIEKLFAQHAAKLSRLAAQAARKKEDMAATGANEATSPVARKRSPAASKMDAQS